MKFFSYAFAISAFSIGFILSACSVVSPTPGSATPAYSSGTVSTNTNPLEIVSVGAGFTLVQAAANKALANNPNGDAEVTADLKVAQQAFLNFVATPTPTAAASAALSAADTMLYNYLLSKGITL